MRYHCKLIIRIIIAFALVLNIGLFYKIFSPLTFNLSKLLLFSYKPVFENSTIIIGEHALEFIPACTAASAYLLLALLTLLTEMPFIKMLKVFITGSAFILLFNLLRIHILINLLVNNNQNLFETLHLFFWKVLATLFVALLWIFLTKIYKISSIPVYTDAKKIISSGRNK